MAELNVRLIDGSGGQTGKYRYEFRSSTPAGTGPLEQEYWAEPNPVLVRQLCGQLDNIVQQALGPTPVGADPSGDLARKGQMLYEVLFPRLAGNIPDLAKRLSQAQGPLLVRTNESLIPWELLHDGQEFLALAHDLGRHTFVESRVAGGRTIGTVARALIVGDPTGDLVSSRREAEQIANWMGEHGVDCTLVMGEQATMLRVIDELASGGYDLLHYCGHVDAPSDYPNYVGLLLHGDELLDGRALAPLAKEGAPPFVFINGCASADRITNLCVSFMVVGAKAVVGTRYEVAERRARRFAERFYVDLISGRSAGEAVRSARRELHDPVGVDWAAFVLYGDPSVQMSTVDTTPKPPTEIGYRLSPEARALMDRVVGQAGSRGVVTSTDLLVHLLSTPDIEGRLADAASAAQLALVGTVLRMGLNTVPAMPGPPPSKVKFSDTVATVLAHSERRALEAGRESITVSDLIAAFAAVGGGSSRQLLDLLNIPLDKLSGDDPIRLEPGFRRRSERDLPRSSPVPPEAGPGTNGRRVPAHPLLDEAGALRFERLEPTVAAAVRVAALLAAANRAQVSTSMLLYGLAVVDSALFQDALREQGDAGVAALRRLSLAAETHGSRFSPRTLRALERAAIDGEPALLREILSEPKSSARELLRRLDVDPDRLLRNGGPDGAEPVPPAGF
jgi:hypothetical protein